MRNIFALCLLLGLACAQGATNAAGNKYLAENAKKEGVATLLSGVQYRVLRSGAEDGSRPRVNELCEFHYKGTVIDGTEFGSSYERGSPLTYAPNQLPTKGLEEALQLMKEGDKWEITVPSELAFGDEGSSHLRSLGVVMEEGDVLVFILEILKVHPERGGSVRGYCIVGLIALSVCCFLVGIVLTLLWCWQRWSAPAGMPAAPQPIDASTKHSPESTKTSEDMDLDPDVEGLQLPAEMASMAPDAENGYVVKSEELIASCKKKTQEITGPIVHQSHGNELTADEKVKVLHSANVPKPAAGSSESGSAAAGSHGRQVVEEVVAPNETVQVSKESKDADAKRKLEQPAVLAVKRRRRRSQERDEQDVRSSSPEAPKLIRHHWTHEENELLASLGRHADASQWLCPGSRDKIDWGKVTSHPDFQALPKVSHNALGKQFMKVLQAR